MSTAHLISDDMSISEAPIQNSHPMDSSRVLLGLMNLYRKAEAADADAEMLDGVISKGVLRSLLSALHFRDVATVRHSRRVAYLAVGMGHYLGWEGRQLKLLEVAALLHDIGKIGVPDNILFKPGQLGPDEAALMSLHYNIGVDVLQACRVDLEVLDIVNQSHSHYNGSTDDFRRIGSDVHFGARILSVADAYDSLATEQVYRESQSHEEIMAILKDASGTQFDGNIVAALERWTEQDGEPFADEESEAASQSQARGPAHREDAMEASSLCHIFSYLYLLESLYDGFFLLDSDLRIVVWNHGAERLLGKSAQEMLNSVWTSQMMPCSNQYGEEVSQYEHPLHKAISTGKSATSQLQIQRGSGHCAPVELQSVPLLDQAGQLQGAAQIFRDVSRTVHRPREFHELKMAATRDALTSVANRGELETQLALALSEYSQHPESQTFSVVFLDIDFFKMINDTYGHSIGDQVLVDVARLLQHETYSGELVARYGGEEFVIICPDTPLDQAVRRAERLRLAICGTTIGGLKDCQVSASFGVAEVEKGDSVESVLRRADKALYLSKENGRNRTSSMTSSDLSHDKPDAGKDETNTDPFVYTGSFMACTAADIIVYKLRGFVLDQSAKLLDVTANRAVIRVGRSGLFATWGASEKKQPVQLQIEFGNEEAPRPNQRRGASRRVEVSVEISPVGRVRDSEVFQNRAKMVMKSLRSYFAADLPS